MSRRIDLGKIVSRIVLVVLLAIGLYMNSYGADLPTKIGLSTPACSLRVLVLIGLPPVLDDSSDWYEDCQVLDSTVTYTSGDFVQRVVEFKYESTDSMMQWEMNPYNSASGVLTQSEVFDTLYQLYTDSSQYFIGGAGSGANAVTIATVNSADSSILGGIPVRIQSLAGDVIYPTLVTSSLGVISWSAAADSVVYVTATTPYSSTWDTIVISGEQTDTVFLTAFNPGAPVDTFLCRCWGYLRDLRSDSTYGLHFGVRNKSVCAAPTDKVKNSCNDTWPLSESYCTSTNDSGYFFLNLVRSSCLLEGTVEVKYRLTIDGNDLKKLILVPDSTSYKITF